MQLTLEDLQSPNLLGEGEQSKTLASSNVYQ